MKSRELSEARIDERVEKKLKKMPEYASEWNEYMKANDKSAATRLDFLRKVNKFLQFVGSEDPKAFTFAKVTAFRNSIQKKEDKEGNLVNTSDSYKISMLYCLRAFFGFMVKAGYMKSNLIDADDIKSLKNKDQARIDAKRVRLTLDDFKAIQAAVAEEKDTFYRARNACIMNLFMTTGIRETALTSLMRENINLEGGILTVIDKEDKTQTFVLNDQTKRYIKRYLGYRSKIKKDDDHMFLTKEGKWITTGEIVLIVQKYTEAALGKALTPHKLRAGVITILYEQKGDIEFCRQYIGHTRLSTTERYLPKDNKIREEGSAVFQF